MKISARQYAQTLYDLTKDANREVIAEIIERFVREMKKNGHIKNGKQVMTQFEAIYDAERHNVKAQVITARPISPMQQQQIDAYIKAKYKAQTVDVVYVQDKTIIGGMIISAGDEVHDASIRKRIDVLSRHLVHNNL